MYPTLIGLVVTLTGLVLLFSASLEAMFAYAMYCTLMGGSAAVVLSSLGNASIPPANAAMVFLLMRVVLPSRSSGPRHLGRAFGANMAYFVFAVWALVTAMIMPRLFKGKIDVVPMKPAGLKNLFDAYPLAFSSQNVTAPVYVIGSFLFAVCAYVAIRQPRGAVVFARAATTLTFIHAALGWAGALLPQSVWHVVTAIVRNGSYAQLDQTIEGYERIAGIMPEASTFAGYGFCWFVLVMELWLRDVLPRRTGLAAAVMGVTLLASTSSTAYVSLAGYAIVLLLRAMIFPSFFRLNKVLLILASLLVGAAAVSGILIFKPSLADSLTSVLQRVTVNKMSGTSGLQRAYWAKQGFTAFKASYGLGIGTGSFRSSNLFTAILGSMGVIGVAAWLIYLLQAFAPLRQSSYLAPRDKVDAVGVAARWAAICAVIPAMLGAPSPDPGVMFSIFAGAALGLLHQSQQRATRLHDDPAPGNRSATIAA